METVLPDQRHRPLPRPLFFGIALAILLAAAGSALAWTGLLAPPSLRGDNPRGPSPGVFVGKTPLSVEFEGWSPDEPVLTMVGQEIELSVAFTNTGPVAGDFYAAVSLRSPEGRWVDLRPLRRVSLKPGARGEAAWQFGPGLVGSWDLVYGVWGNWREGREPEVAVGNTGILEGRIVAFQQCLEIPASANLVRIERYTPFQEVHTSTGDEVRLDIAFTNIGDADRDFSAGATVWRAGKSDAIDADYRSRTSQPLRPGGTATMSWLHRLETDGSYQPAFSIWDSEDRLLLRAPCPRHRLLVAVPPQSPRIIGVGPGQPISQASRQWLSLRGNNFTEESKVVISIQGNRYPVPKERTELVSPQELRVLVGLTDPGTWNAQVVNSGDLESNLFEFEGANVKSCGNSFQPSDLLGCRWNPLA